MTPSPESVVEVVGAQAFPAEPSREAAAMASALAALGGAAVRGIVFFGSRKTRAGPDAHSAYDFFVVTEGYGPFYRSLAAAGSLRRAPWLVSLLNRVLPPNQVSLRVSDGSGERHAKCAVIDVAALRRETSSARRDHFCAGRLFQPSEVVWAQDDAARASLLEALVAAHTETFGWVRPFLRAEFDATDYANTLLKVSLSQEIRPEPEGRAQALFASQAPALVRSYTALLAELAAAGELIAVGPGRYRLARAAGWRERLRIDLYFRRSLVRATLRWFKYMVTFEGWLDYIRRKAERHTGEPIELTPREQRLPLVFLWPRLFRYLRDKNRPGRPS